VFTMIGGCPQTANEKDELELIEIIKTLFQKGRKNYGTRRLKKALLSLGRQISRRRIGRLMATAGLACKTRANLKRPRIQSIICPFRQITWIGNSRYRNRIRPMLATSPISPPWKAGCTRL
jgi:hypothetical protein